MGALSALLLLSLLSIWSRQLLIVAPLGASSVLLFGYPRSPLAQPRNLLLGNALGGLVGVVSGQWLGTGPLVLALAVALTIVLGQQLRCLTLQQVGWPFWWFFWAVPGGFCSFLS